MDYKEKALTDEFNNDVFYEQETVIRTDHWTIMNSVGQEVDKSEYTVVSTNFYRWLIEELHQRMIT